MPEVVARSILSEALRAEPDRESESLVDARSRSREFSSLLISPGSEPPSVEMLRRNYPGTSRY